VDSSARLRPAERVHRRGEFQEIYASGVRTHGRFSTTFVLFRGTGSPARLGIAATKKLGNAVQRNRAKRLIREVFRRNKIGAGYDIVVVPKRELLHTSLAILEADYRTTLERQLARARGAGSHSGL